MNERTVIVKRTRTWRTPLGDTVTARKFIDSFNRVHEAVTIECPIELVDVGHNWPNREKFT